MASKDETTGAHQIALSFELPGTPEQVWEAIATGPGISSWFVPTEVEPGVGGDLVFHLGPDMHSSGRITAWQPPRRFAYEEPDWSGDAPPLGTEFIIEARAGGSCTVRLVHSLFTDQDDWDDQLDSMEKGWPPFFAVLAVYLRDFPGQRCASLRPTGQFVGSHAAAQAALWQALGLTDATVGERRDTAINGGPRLVGVVERFGDNPNNCELLLRLEQPANGVALIGTYEWEGTVNIAISLYFYGDDADAVLASEAPRWQAWIERHFKPQTPPTAQ